MALNIKQISALIAAFALMASAFMFAIPAHANPIRQAPPSSTASATTSPTFMTPGTATTTVYLDSFAGGSTQQYDAVSLLTQLFASSTATTLNMTVEYSDGVAGVDCTATPTACDWYQDATIAMTNASTSQPYAISNNSLNTYSWTYASTTQGGAAGVATSNRGLKAINIPVTTRYVRVFYTLAIGGTNGAVWGKLVPFKQSN